MMTFCLTVSLIKLFDLTQIEQNVSIKSQTLDPSPDEVLTDDDLHLHPALSLVPFSSRHAEVEIKKRSSGV